jgi:hypothetical protein
LLLLNPLPHLKSQAKDQPHALALSRSRTALLASLLPTIFASSFLLPQPAAPLLHAAQYTHSLSFFPSFFSLSTFHFAAQQLSFL